MKKIINIVILSIASCQLSTFLSSCGEELMRYEVNSDTPVVESYLEEGTNNLTVKLYTIEMYSEDEYLLSNPVSGVKVDINGKILTETVEGTYSLDLGEDTVRGLQNYDLQFEYKGKNISGSTSIPQPVTGVYVDPESITKTSSSIYWGSTDTTKITVYWDDPDNSYYQVYINSPESSTSGFGGNFAKRIMQPFQGNSYQINSPEIRAFGTYTISVYRVNKDYVELYERISSSDLANPVSFIENAFGIFTSMSVTSVRFKVYESE